MEAVIQEKVMRTSWLRNAATFVNVIQELEAEIKRMKTKKIPQEIIDKKDLQIEELVNFYNDAEDLIQLYKHSLINARAENHFLIDMLAKKITMQDFLNSKQSSRG